MKSVSQQRYLRSQCIDEKNGIFAVEKSFSGPSIPIHVIKNTWGPTQRSVCEEDLCSINAEFAHRSGLLPFECNHILSLTYSPRVNQTPTDLTEETLAHMVQQKWFGEVRKQQLLQLKETARERDVPLSVAIQIGQPKTKFHVSVFEPRVAYYSRLGRVMVTYDGKKNSWHCPCAMPRKSCIHKAVAKCHLFHTHKHLFQKVKSTDTEDLPPCPSEDERFDKCYPPSEAHVKKMIHYMMTYKKLPSELPKSLVDRSRDAKSCTSFPRHLVPTEVTCTECTDKTILSEPRLITANAKILMFTGIIYGM